MDQQQLNNTETIDFRDLFFKYLKKWYLFAISIAICIVLMFLYMQTVQDKYTVNSTVLIRVDDGGVSSMMAELNVLNSLGIGSASKQIEDELQIINSKNIKYQVIEALGIQGESYTKEGLRYVEQYPTTPIAANFAPLFADTLKSAAEIIVSKRATDYKVKIRYANLQETKIVADIFTAFPSIVGPLSFSENEAMKDETWQMKFVMLPKQVVMEKLQSSITATQVKKDSKVIQISTTSATPKKATDIINKIIELYNLDAVIDKNMTASNTGRFIDERLILITQELSDVELNVESYKRHNQLTDISSEAKMFLESASEYQKQVAKFETQLNLIEYIREYVSDEKNRYGLIPANLGIEDQSLILLTKEYNDALLERMRLLRTTNVQNPVIIQVEEQLQLVRLNIITSITSLKDGITIAKNDLLRKDKQFEDRIKSVPTQERQFIEIKRQQQIKETLYLYLFQKREENALALAMTIQPAKIIDATHHSLEPVSPAKKVLFFIAFMIGVILPVVGMYLYDFINNTITDAKEFEKRIKAPLLGMICNSSDADADRVVVSATKVTPVVELFRLIRTNLGFTVTAKNPTILVTSSISSEGKSFISLNLAIALSLINKRVVLIGLDIRNPMLSNYMHLSHKGYLTSYLADTSYTIDDIIMPSKVEPLLDVIPAGPVPPNPSELLLSSRLDELVAELKTRYDYIIIDSAPVGMVSDTFLLNRLADATLYISRVNHTPRETINFINQIYEQHKLKNMMCILNGVNEHVNFGNAFGYGYGYAHKKERKKGNS